jgi:hypothetical protein
VARAPANAVSRLRQHASGRCGQGSSCAQFRADLKSFALDIADLKQRFPVIEQHGLGDTPVFADATDILPPFVLFGLYEILQHVPDWQDLPADLAQIFDEIGDPEVFSSGGLSAQAAVASARTGINAVAHGTAYFGPPKTRADRFCSQGKEPLVDDVRINEMKSVLVRWKNRFDSFSEYPPDEAMVSLVGEGGGAVKIPLGAIFTTVSNIIDSIGNAVETYRADLEVCKKIETDVAQCTPLVEYRTPKGNVTAYWVVAGVMNRASLIGSDKTTAISYLNQAGAEYHNSNWRQAYADICKAYGTL